jgi:enoyl-CoA hydratase/carnithine racemase
LINLIFTQDPKDAQPAVEETEPEVLIKSEKTGTVTLIGINRAEVRNCINSHAAAELSTAIEEFENDPESPIAVLYGIGGNFCAGYDLKELSENIDNVANVLLRSEGAMVS